ncbi:MAG: hypothetical protein AAGD07_17730, partial [Planctomycetota bacterium]
ATSLDFALDVLAGPLSGASQVDITMAVLQGEYYLAEPDNTTPTVDLERRTCQHRERHRLKPHRKFTSHLADGSLPIRERFRGKDPTLAQTRVRRTRRQSPSTPCSDLHRQPPPNPWKRTMPLARRAPLGRTRVRRTRRRSPSTPCSDPQRFPPPSQGVRSHDARRT